jgi:hypothetical protein
MAVREEAVVLVTQLELIFTCGRVPDKILFFGFSPGDDLLCTAVVTELQSRDTSCLMMCSYPELFVGLNTHVPIELVTEDHRSYGLKFERYKRVAQKGGLEFHSLVYAPFDGKDRSVPPRRHIIAELCAGVGIDGPVSIRPYLCLSDTEREGAAWAHGYIAIQSSGMSARLPMRNKQWYPERFQMVVDALHSEFQFIQLGAKGDPTLDHVTDLRGKTSIRETAALLHNVRLYVGTVGFLMHLSRAVDCPGVIIFGGREAPWQSGYVCNVNLYTGVDCAPCWRWNTCEFDRKCMDQISPDDVVRAVREVVRRPRDRLPVEVVAI